MESPSYDMSDESTDKEQMITSIIVFQHVFGDSHMRDRNLSKTTSMAGSLRKALRSCPSWVETCQVIRTKAIRARRGSAAARTEKESGLLR